MIAPSVSLIPASLIIVSRHRTDALLRAIVAVRQLDHPRLELIVVADPAAIAVGAGYRSCCQTDRL